VDRTWRVDRVNGECVHPHEPHTPAHQQPGRVLGQRLITGTEKQTACSRRHSREIIRHHRMTVGHVHEQGRADEHVERQLVHRSSAGQQMGGRVDVCAGMCAEHEPTQCELDRAVRGRDRRDLHRRIARVAARGGPKRRGDVDVYPAVAG
jgi:hypothetical protein